MRKRKKNEANVVFFSDEGGWFFFIFKNRWAINGTDKQKKSFERRSQQFFVKGPRLLRWFLFFRLVPSKLTGDRSRKKGEIVPLFFHFILRWCRYMIARSFFYGLVDKQYRYQNCDKVRRWLETSFDEVLGRFFLNFVRFFCQISFGRHRRLLHNREIGVVVDKPMEKLGPRCETFFSFFLGRSFPVIFFWRPEIRNGKCAVLVCSTTSGRARVEPICSLIGKAIAQLDQT